MRANPLRMPGRLTVLVAMTLWLCLGAQIPGVLAHGEHLDIIVTPPIVQPGDEIFIQAQVLWTEEAVAVDLVGSDGAVHPMGSGETRPDGSLFLGLRVPGDARAGRWAVVVRNSLGEEAEGSLVIREDPPLLAMAASGVAGLGVLALVAGGRIRRARRAT
jgi:hypothetical protein